MFQNVKGHHRPSEIRLLPLNLRRYVLIFTAKLRKNLVMKNRELVIMQYASKVDKRIILRNNVLMNDSRYLELEVSIDRFMHDKRNHSH